MCGVQFISYATLLYLVSVASLYTVRDRVVWWTRYRLVDVGVALLGAIAVMYVLSWSEVVMMGALLAAGRVDFDAYVVPQCFSVWLIPVGVLCAAMGWSSITWFESVAAAVIGYGFLWGINRLFMIIKRQPGIGVGDMEVLAMMGSFVGIAVMWDMLLISSIIGLVIATSYVVYQHRMSGAMRFPFASFLFIGTCMYYLWW